MEDDYRKNSNLYCYINIFVVGISSATPTIQCIDDIGIHDIDIKMENVSIGPAQYFMADGLRINVRVRITISGYNTYTDK